MTAFVATVLISVPSVPKFPRNFYQHLGRGGGFALREKDRDLSRAIEKAGCAPSFHELTNKIRTNPELAVFVRVVFDLKTAQPGQSFDNVRIINAKSALDAHRRLALLEKDGFKPIPLTSSKYYSDSYGFDLLDSAGWDNSHVVIGQEFDKVAVAAGPNFYYDDKGVLRSKPHPYPNYIAENCYSRQ